MKRKGIKILSWSFWLIATAHIVAFTAIGLFTGAGWKLLLIFLVGIPVFLLVKKYIVKRGKVRNIEENSQT